MTTRRKKTTRSKPSEAIPSLFEHRFERPELLMWALTHRSLAYESKPETQPSPDADNEQLEFVGDAVLGIIKVQPDGFGRQPFAPPRVVGEQLPQMDVLDLVEVL